MRFVGSLVLVLCLLLVFGRGSARADAERNKQFATMADQMVQQIRRELETRSGESNADRLRVAIRPFNERDIPVSQSTADLFYDLLTANLLSHREWAFSLVERKDLEQVINEVAESGTSIADTNDNLIALLNKTSDVDALIHGDIRLDGGTNVRLIYKAISMTGNTIATSNPQYFDLKPTERQGGADLIDYRQAAVRAAKSLVDSAGSVKEIVIDGVTFEDKGLRTNFSQDVEERLSDEMRGLLTQSLTGRKLTIRRLSIGKTRSASPSLNPLEQLGDDGSYLLTGNWWVWPDTETVELRITLKNKAGQSVSWTGTSSLDH